MLVINQAVCGYQTPGNRVGTAILKEFSFRLSGGETVCLLGANGAGKTTLFKTILGILPLLSGEILLDGKSISQIPKRQLAQLVGYVPQSHTPPFPFTVEEVVLMGRTAYISLTATPSKVDRKIAEQTLEQMGISHLAGKSYTEISGGERQMVLIARALTQNPKLLIMDEPTSNLDFGNQILVLKQIKKLSSSGIGILFSSHNPDHAFYTRANVAVIKNKTEFLFGAAKIIVTKQLIKDLYQIDSHIAEFTAQNGQITTAVIPYL